MNHRRVGAHLSSTSTWPSVRPHRWNLYRNASDTSPQISEREHRLCRKPIRYRPEPGAKPELVHTLNGSGLALARVVAAR